MAPRLAIIADDLTGAADTAAPFAARGARVGVALSPSAVTDALARRPDVLAVCTDSREIGPDEARARVAAVVAALPAGIRVFKKVDSRLKGNIAAEMQALHFDRALVAPAIPAFGRIAAGGRIEGFGLSAPVEIAPALGEALARARIPDTRTPDDMRAALASADGDLLVGARGLGEVLAEAMFPAPPATIERLPGPRALIVVGSHDPITLAQVAAVADAGAAAIVPAPSGRADAVLDKTRMVLLATPEGPPVAPHTVAARLAEAVIAAPPFQTLLITGGATAAVVLARMKIASLDLLGEVLPGLPVAQARGMSIVLKSGGFGGAETLLQLLGRIEGGKGSG